MIFAVGALGPILLESDKVYVVRNFGVHDVLIDDIIRLRREKQSLRKGDKRKLHKSINIEKLQRVPCKNSIPDEKILRFNYDEITVQWRGREVNINLRGPIRRTLKERSQIRALALAIRYASRYADGRNTLKEIVYNVIKDIKQYGLDILNPSSEAQFSLATFTPYQLFYSLSRLSTLKIAKRGY